MIQTPERLAHLDRDERGYPIPWNVLRAEDGTPFFTVNDDRKAWLALREQLCPICGARLGQWKWFVGGPKSAFDVNGWYVELPGHQECIRYSLQVCPYLAAPKYQGRIDVVHAEKLPPEASIMLDETIITDRPEVFVAVGSMRMETASRGPLLQPYVRPARPAHAYEYWRHGKQLTEEEAMPYLRAVFGADWDVPKVREA